MLLTVLKSIVLASSPPCITNEVTELVNTLPTDEIAVPFASTCTVLPAPEPAEPMMMSSPESARMLSSPFTNRADTESSDLDSSCSS